MLRSLWAALLQDYAILSTQHPATLSAYASELLPPQPLGDGAERDVGGGSSASPLMGAAVRDVYRRACPQVLYNRLARGRGGRGVASWG